MAFYKTTENELINLDVVTLISKHNNPNRTVFTLDALDNLGFCITASTNEPLSAVIEKLEAAGIKII